MPSVPAQLSSCISCHTTGSKYPIRFGDEGELKKALREKSKTHPDRSLLAEIEARIDSGDMPQSATLSSEEKASLKAYFKSAAGGGN